MLNVKVAKRLKFPFTTNGTRAIAPNDLIHSDVWGPAPTPSLAGFFIELTTLSLLFSLDFDLLRHKSDYLFSEIPDNGGNSIAAIDQSISV